MDTKTRPKAPAKTYRGGQFAVQKISISRACETKLGCVLSFLENAIKTGRCSCVYTKTIIHFNVGEWWQNIYLHFKEIEPSIGN